jgi:hypothetical protein
VAAAVRIGSYFLTTVLPYATAPSGAFLLDPLATHAENNYSLWFWRLFYLPD